MILRQQIDPASTALVHQWVVQGVDLELLPHTLQLELDRLLHSTTRGRPLPSLSCAWKILPSQALSPSRSWTLSRPPNLRLEALILLLTLGLNPGPNLKPEPLGQARERLSQRRVVEFQLKPFNLKLSGNEVYYTV